MNQRRAKQQEVLCGIYPGTHTVLTASHRSRSVSTQHTLRGHRGQRGQTLNMLLGERAGLGAENSSSSGFLVVEAGAGWVGVGRDTSHTPCLYLHPGQLVPGGRETQVGLEIPEEKEDIPRHLKTKGPLAWVGSPCPTAWRSEQSDGREVCESSQGLRSGCLQHTERTLWKTFPMMLTAQAPFAGPLPTPAVRRA